MARVPKDEVQRSKRSARPALGSLLKHDASDGELLKQVIEFYCATLKTNPAALDYLKKRGLVNASMVDKFKLGFADRSLGLVLPERNRKAGKEIRQRLTSLGILRESGHERFRGAVVFPLFDAQGRVVQVYGRMVGVGLRASVPRHLWLDSEKGGLFNLDAFSSKEIIVTASVIDALTFWNHDLKNVTAIHGFDGQSVNLLNALKQYGTKKVVIAHRRNPGTDQAAEQLSEKIHAEGIDVFRIELPKGLDANQFVLKVKDAPKALAELPNC